MTNPTDMKHQTSKQHIELGTSRQFRHAVDLNPLSANFTKWSYKLKQFVRKLPTNCLRVKKKFWFKDSDPFQPIVNLQSFSSGLTATKQKLLAIQSKLDCKIVDNCSMKRKDHVRTFTSL